MKQHIIAAKSLAEKVRKERGRTQEEPGERARTWGGEGKGLWGSGEPAYDSRVVLRRTGGGPWRETHGVKEKGSVVTWTLGTGRRRGRLQLETSVLTKVKVVFRFGGKITGKSRLELVRRNGTTWAYPGVSSFFYFFYF